MQLEFIFVLIAQQKTKCVGRSHEDFEYAKKQAQIPTRLRNEIENYV